MYVSCFLVGNKPPQDILKGAQLSASVSKRSSYLTTLGECFIVNFYSAMYDIFFFSGLLLFIGNCEVFSVRFTEIILPTGMVRKPSGFF